MSKFEENNNNENQEIKNNQNHDENKNSNENTNNNNFQQNVNNNNSNNNQTHHANKEKTNDNHVNQNDNKKAKARFDLKKAHDENTLLRKELQKKQEKIESLERQINIINESFKTEVIKKAQEAQAQLQGKIKEYQEKYDVELKHAKKYALKNSAIDLIDIISNFEMAVNSKSSNPEIINYLKGFQMFINMFKNFLSQNGISEIVVNENDDFNAETMQAFDTEKREGYEPNKVIRIAKKGYKLHDIIIVPTTVIVSE